MRIFVRSKDAQKQLARTSLTATRAAKVDIDVINYATKYTDKMKANFFYCDQIKFNEAVPEPGIP